MFRDFVLMLGLLVLVGASAAPPARFSAPHFDNDVDLHGDPTGADLVVFVAGNQWFVIPQLMAAFQAEHPDVHRIFYETLPPGILATQIERGALAIDGLVLHLHPDVYVSVPGRTALLRARGLVSRTETFATNDLGIMVRAGNPHHIHSMRDLGRSAIRVAMPNPQTEGIARQIEMAYKLAGGTALDTAIMRTKVADGSTVLTSIHHRETPSWIINGTADAGPVWLTEAQYQERIRSGIAAVRIPPSENVTAAYVASLVTGAPHRAAAQAFLAFLLSPRGQAIYRSYGFGPPVSTKE
jgi:molybdate transport system substrate-binding protein